jgi:hypothetical protein
VNVLTEQSTSAVAFLESLGINLDVLSQCGGHSVRLSYLPQHITNITNSTEQIERERENER